ncbi:hypothetical protein NDU88_002107 [Pleurodeles waltl]|uniref:Uncharacterized protein n=1 Tax=Pleurodeles waltl TaxID=8319 RepID=A0AAV7SEG9_PLEWA|nr:hypothetical protein NDU88_002107 [Pleurodeles waltl]
MGGGPAAYAAQEQYNEGGGQPSLPVSRSDQNTPVASASGRRCFRLMLQAEAAQFPGPSRLSARCAWRADYLLRCPSIPTLLLCPFSLSNPHHSFYVSFPASV